MGMQDIDGHYGYVVEFDSLPALPVTGIGYEKPFAEALTDAILNRVITEGGKYFIRLTAQMGDYFRYEIDKITD